MKPTIPLCCSPAAYQLLARQVETIDSPDALLTGAVAIAMRGLHQATVAVRNPEGEIVFKHEPLNVERRRMWENLPFLRGILMLWDALNLGTRALNFSATVAIGEEDEPPSSLATTGALILSLVFAIGLFFVLPAFLASLAERYGATPLQREVIQGLIRLLLFLGYIIIISRLPDIKRVFEYHGAEHKTVFAWEAGDDLTVANARRHPRQHPRCGTSFLMVVMLVSIVLFSVVKFDSLALNMLTRIALIPLIAGISYEIIRAAGKKESGAIFKLMTLPGIWMQNLTTREPSDDQLEVAIYALKESLKLEPQSELQPATA